MKRILFLLLFFPCLTLNAQDKEGTIFLENKTYDEILASASQAQKPVLIYFYASWCKPCEMLLKNVFSEEEVGKFFNENFVCVLFDVDSDEGKGVSNLYEIKHIPTIYFLNTEGTAVDKHVDAQITAEELLEKGKLILTQ